MDYSSYQLALLRFVWPHLEKTVSSTELISLIVALLSVLGMAGTAVLSGWFQSRTAKAQINKDLILVELQALIREEQVVREKFEGLAAQLCDLPESKDGLHRVRSAGLSLLAYSGPELASAAINIVLAVECIYRTDGDENRVKAESNLAEATSRLTKAFLSEVVERRHKRGTVSAFAA